MRKTPCAALIVCCLCSSVSASSLPNPYYAQVLAITDGDTFEAQIQIWFRQVVYNKVRILGVNTPEPRGKCENERKLAAEASQFLEKLLPVNTIVLLQKIKQDPYRNRVDAEVILENKSIGQQILDAGHGVPYDGKKKAVSVWCEEKKSGAPYASPARK